MSTVREIQNEEHKLEMTPMIDVTFLLLVFFLCTLQFKTLEGRLSAYLPEDVGQNASPAEAIEKIEVSIVVVAAGEPAVGGSPRAEYAGREVGYRVGPRACANLDQVRERLRQLFAADRERRVTIRAGTGTVYADVVGVLDAAVAAGFTDIAFR